MFQTARLAHAFSTLLLGSALVVGAGTVDTLADDAGESLAPMAFSFSGSGSGILLGVQTEEETERAGGGALVTRVIDGSAAEEAGLMKGDIIVEVDGRAIHGPHGLAKAIRTGEPGDEISVRIVREGQEQTVDVVLAKQPGLFGYSVGDQRYAVVAPSAGCIGSDDCRSFSFDFGRMSRRPVLGVQLVQVTDELRGHLGGEPGAGVLVSRIVPGSPAEIGGIEVGDLIVAIGNDRVETVRDIRESLHGRQGETFGVELIRDGRATIVEVSVPEPDDAPPTGPRA